MNITLYSHEAFIRYILYCFMFGIISAVFYCVMSVIITLPSVFKCNDISSVKKYCSELLVGGDKCRCVRDILFFVILAIALLAVTFLANSGVFRIVSVPLLLIGFATGILFFKRILITSMAYLLFATKKVVSFLCLPILLFVRVIYRILSRITNAAGNHMRKIWIAKYTRSKYKELGIIKQTGMLDCSFEVV